MLEQTQNFYFLVALSRIGRNQAGNRIGLYGEEPAITLHEQKFLGSLETRIQSAMPVKGPVPVVRNLLIIQLTRRVGS
jgi:hypothetical protein